MIDFLRRLWSVTRPYKVRLGLGVIFGMLSGLAEPLLIVTVAFVFKMVFNHSADLGLEASVQKLPKFVQNLSVVQNVLTHVQAWVTSWGAAPSKAVIVLSIATIPIVMMMRGVIGYLHTYLMNWVAARAINDLRIKVFDHLLNLPMSFFSKNSTGELMSRVGDINVLQAIICSSLVVVVKEPVTLVSLVTVLFASQPQLTLFTMLVFPVCLVPIIIYSRKIRHSSAEIQTEYAALSRAMHESFTGNRIIKAYNLERTVVDRFRETSGKVLTHFMRVVRSTEIPGPLIEFFGSIGVAILLFYVAMGVNAPTSADEFIKFVGCIFMIYRPMKAVIRLQNQVVQARAATGRVFELLDTQSDLPEPPNPRPLQPVGARIRFAGVQFNYGEKPVLHGIDLTVEPGQLLALVGASGSGKTTLTSLLLRFYDPTEGRIEIGATDIRTVATSELRKNIAVVTQETILFNDTIRNNIAVGRAGATRKEIEAAAQHAYAHEFIMEKPDGYETLIGEKGIALSGGQRQRVAIARAILKDAPILVLDEATSSLDTESERAVQAALDELMQGRTTICIAHRLSTVQNADVIVVMDQGRIVETGKHEELVRRNGIYRKLYELQFRSEPTSSTLLST